MNKKGISPLIATVLIIGFTVALAAIIMTWGTTFSDKWKLEKAKCLESCQEAGMLFDDTSGGNGGNFDEYICKCISYIEKEKPQPYNINAKIRVVDKENKPILANISCIDNSTGKEVINHITSEEDWLSIPKVFMNGTYCCSLIDSRFKPLTSCAYVDKFSYNWVLKAELLPIPPKNVTFNISLGLDQVTNLFDEISEKDISYDFDYAIIKYPEGDTEELTKDDIHLSSDTGFSTLMYEKKLYGYSYNACFMEREYYEPVYNGSRVERLYKRTEEVQICNSTKNNIQVTLIWEGN
jgi:flagellin-like protein